MTFVKRINKKTKTVKVLLGKKIIKKFKVPKVSPSLGVVKQREGSAIIGYVRKNKHGDIIGLKKKIIKIPKKTNKIVRVKVGNKILSVAK